MTTCTCGHTPGKGIKNARGARLRANAVLSYDPTRTTGLRREFMAAMYKRFRALKGKIKRAIVDHDVFGLRDSQPLPRLRLQAVPEARAFAFTRDAQKIDGFMNWLQGEVDEGILEVQSLTGGRPGMDPRWTDTYVRRAYRKGQTRGRQELNKAGIQVGDPAAIEAVFDSPAHADRLAAIYTRTYNELKGVTNAMSQQISRTLADGLAQGLNPNVIARMLNDRVDKIGITRARTLARTEVVRAHHVATVAEYRAAGLDRVRIKAEWSTAGHNVCPLCAPREGKVYTLDEIEGMIPLHPNCRCVALPVVGDDLPRRTRAPQATAPEIEMANIPGVPGYQLQKKVLDWIEKDSQWTIENLKLNTQSGRRAVASLTPSKLNKHQRGLVNTVRSFLSDKEINLFKSSLTDKAAGTAHTLKKPIKPTARAARAAAVPNPKSYTQAVNEFDNYAAQLKDITPLKDYATRNYHARDGFSSDNAILRGGGKATTRAKKLDTILKNAPSYEGEVYRGLNFVSNNEMKQFAVGAKPNKILVDRGFVSTSQDMGTAISYAETSEYSAVIHIESKSGTPIQSYSQYEEEAEVLFRPRTRFKVMRTTMEDEIMHVYAREI